MPLNKHLKKEPDVKTAAFTAVRDQIGSLRRCISRPTLCRILRDHTDRVVIPAVREVGNHFGQAGSALVGLAPGSARSAARIIENQINRLRSSDDGARGGTILITHSVGTMIKALGSKFSARRLQHDDKNRQRQ